MSSTGGKSGDWMKSPAFLAGAGHALAGCLFVTTAAYLFGYVAVIFTVIGLAAVALVKEYVIDLRVESDETVWSSTVDFLEYMAGAAVGVLLVFVAKPLLLHHGIDVPHCPIELVP
jgi:hypothetical protein